MFTRKMALKNYAFIEKATQQTHIVYHETPKHLTLRTDVQAKNTQQNATLCGIDYLSMDWNAAYYKPILRGQADTADAKFIPHHEDITDNRPQSRTVQQKYAEQILDEYVLLK